MSAFYELTPSDLARFWAKVQVTPTCWLWKASINSKGYGKFGWHRQVLIAPRVSWVIHRGPIPDGLCVLHNCPGGDNPACVNPDHLWLGTKGENAIDRDIKGRLPKGSAHRNSRLTEGDVMAIRQAYATSGTSSNELAQRFGTTKGNILGIIRGVYWRHLPLIPLQAPPRQMRAIREAHLRGRDGRYVASAQTTHPT